VCLPNTNASTKARQKVAYSSLLQYLSNTILIPFLLFYFIILYYYVDSVDTLTSQLTSMFSVIMTETVISRNLKLGGMYKFVGGINRREAQIYI